MARKPSRKITLIREGPKYSRLALERFRARSPKLYEILRETLSKIFANRPIFVNLVFNNGPLSSSDLSHLIRLFEESKYNYLKEFSYVRQNEIRLSFSRDYKPVLNFFQSNAIRKFKEAVNNEKIARIYIDILFNFHFFKKKKFSMLFRRKPKNFILAFNSLAESFGYKATPIKSDNANEEKFIYEKRIKSVPMQNKSFFLTPAQTSAFNSLYKACGKITPYLKSSSDPFFVFNFYDNLQKKLNTPKKPSVLELSFPIEFIQLETNPEINEFIASLNTLMHVSGYKGLKVLESKSGLILSYFRYVDPKIGIHNFKPIPTLIWTKENDTNRVAL
jgi:hypothetical protein